MLVSACSQEIQFQPINPTEPSLVSLTQLQLVFTPLWLTPSVVLMSMHSKEIRHLDIDPTDPSLVGLTRGAAVVRRNQQTRTLLGILKRIQRIQSGTEDGGDGSKMLQVGGSVVKGVGDAHPSCQT